MERQKIKNQIKLRRRKRARRKIFGTAKRPRLSVFRGLKSIYAQLINDEIGQTLVSANSREIKKSSLMEQAKALGELIAERALAQGIKQAVFDRSVFKYHGRVKAVADGARAAGLKI